MRAPLASQVFRWSWLPWSWRGLAAGRTFPRLLLALAIAQVVALAGAQRPHAPFACWPSGEPAPALWAIADFDGDNAIDVARIQPPRTGPVPAVHLFSLCEGSLASLLGSPPPRSMAPGTTAANFAVARGLVLSARDVDADHDADLVLREPLAGRAVGLWLNDGTGAFSPTDPEAFPAASADGPCLYGVARQASPSPAAPTAKRALASAPQGESVEAPPQAPQHAAASRAIVCRGWHGATSGRGPPALS